MWSHLRFPRGLYSLLPSDQALQHLAPCGLILPPGQCQAGLPAGLGPSLRPNVPSLPPGSASPGDAAMTWFSETGTYHKEVKGSKQDSLVPEATLPSLASTSLAHQPLWMPVGCPIASESQVGRSQPSTGALGRHSSLAFREQQFSHLSASQGGQKRLIRAQSHLVASFIIAYYGNHWQTWLSCL